jgi:uncharacterized membrane protein
MNPNKLFNYFLRGLLLVVPVAATIYIIFVTIQWVDGLIPVNIPGLGFVIVIVGITFIGIVANSIIAQPIISVINGMIKRVPLVNFIYSSLNDVIGAVAGEKKKFNQPVLVPFDGAETLYKPGFITQSDLSKADLEEYVAVYLPHSYNFSGNIFLVKRSKLIPIKGSNAEIMKYIVSAGVSGDIGRKIEK